MKNKEIVITGGLGFIGSHISDALVDDNHVTIIDDKSSGKLSNLKDSGHENLDIVIGGINDLDLKGLFEGKDFIFHHAAMASVPLSIKYPKKADYFNATGTLDVLSAANEAGVKKLINASSSAVYGDNTNMPLKEEDYLHPLSPYAASKAVGEFYCDIYTGTYGLDTVSFRYFNVFGSKQNPDSQYAAVIPKFIDALLRNESPVIYGDGEQSRDFISVNNIVKANIAACESSYTGVLNLASGKAISITELFHLIRSIMHSSVNVKYVSARQGDIIHSLANIDKLKDINFKPDPNFKEELSNTIEWFINKNE